MDKTALKDLLVIVERHTTDLYLEQDDLEFKINKALDTARILKNELVTMGDA